MLRLEPHDLRAVLDCLRMIYATLDAFPRQIIAGLRQMVPAPFGSYRRQESGAPSEPSGQQGRPPENDLYHPFRNGRNGWLLLSDLRGMKMSPYRGVPA